LAQGSAGFLGFGFSAICQLPIAICLLSKTVQLTTFSLWSEFPALPFCSPFCQAKTLSIVTIFPRLCGEESCYCFSVRSFMSSVVKDSSLEKYIR
jgi:hypothetical protein